MWGTVRIISRELLNRGEKALARLGAAAMDAERVAARLRELSAVVSAEGFRQASREYLERFCDEFTDSEENKPASYFGLASS